MTYKEVIQFIDLQRLSFEGSIQVYTEGSCFWFSQILINRFPEGKAYSNVDHWITKIGERFYDITGEVNGEGYLEMNPNWIEFKRQFYHSYSTSTGIIKYTRPDNYGEYSITEIIEDIKHQNYERDHT